MRQAAEATRRQGALAYVVAFASGGAKDVTQRCATRSVAGVSKQETSSDTNRDSL